jgi:tetratricopeptide (TPR) repeat protein
LALLVLGSLFGPEHLAQSRSRAEAAARAGDWAAALAHWRRINVTSGATGLTYLGEGRACLALGRAAQAERALRKTIAALPSEAEAWLILVEIMHVEDRPIDAFSLGWNAIEQVSPEARTVLLRELTFLALTDLPDDLTRTTLRRWIEADTTDTDAEVAYLRRTGAEPRSSDPDRQTRLDRLTDLLAQHPDHVGAREALVTALADAGEPEQGRTLLDGWPEANRDARYWRLRGRWDLEYDHRPDQAVLAFRAALEVLPQDWRTHYRLARALRMLGRRDEAQEEAVTVGRIRELLDPLTLGPKLDAAFAHLDEPSAFDALADLCARVGLLHLAGAWRASADHQTKDWPRDKNGATLRP